MIKIDGFENEYVLDLNLVPEDEHEITVISEDENGRKISWGIDIISLEEITAIAHSEDKLSIYLDAKSLNKDGIILLRNYNKEKIIIKIIHNEELSKPKKYKFRISKKSSSDRKVSIRILSKENDKETSWTCTYDGKPLNYNINPMHSDKSGKVEIELLDILFSTIDTIIEFTQDNSGEVVSLRLSQTNDNITIKAD